MQQTIFRFLSRAGSVLTVAGSIGLMLGFLGVLDFDDYAIGISAGIRVLGSVAIGGCLMGAIGFYGLESNDTRESHDNNR